MRRSYVFPDVVKPVSNGMMIFINLVVKIPMILDVVSMKVINLFVLLTFNLPPNSKQEYQ